jgi:hypothetical protein
MVRERFPDNELTMEIASREAFDAEETPAYATDLDAAIEEQGILEAAHVARSLPEELREEGNIINEPPDDGNKVDYDDFVHLNDDDLNGDFLAELGDDREAKEADAEQRALMALFETKRCDESVRWFMVTERRAPAARLAAAEQAARQSAHRCNMAAAREEMVAAEWRRQEQEDHAGAEASMAMASQRRDS